MKKKTHEEFLKQVDDLQMMYLGNTKDDISIFWLDAKLMGTNGMLCQEIF